MPADEKTALPLHTDPVYLSALAQLPAASLRSDHFARKHSIAVLPFLNLGGSREGEALADGVSEDIITVLSRHSELSVIARTSSFLFKGQSKSAKAIATELGVRFILEGSVRQSSGRVRVTATLVDALSDEQIWTERYDGALDDIFEIQDNIALAVGSSTHTELMLADFGWRESSPAGTPQARALAGQAALRMYDYTPEGREEAERLIQQALALDPKDPRALRIRVTIDLDKTSFGLLPPTLETHERNFRAAQEAVRLAPRDENAHYVLSWALSNLHRYSEAIAELRIALAINPNLALAHGDLADNYALMGRPSEAIEAAEIALRLNPIDPSNFWRHHSIAVAHFLSGRFAEAEAGAQEVLRQKPTFLRSALIWAAAAAASDNMDNAKLAMNTVCSIAPDLTCSTLCPGYMSGFARPEHQSLFLSMLRKAGLRE